jgi:XRE family transcriptional regulator, regulator of sulfur utilization
MVLRPLPLTARAGWYALRIQQAVRRPFAKQPVAGAVQYHFIFVHCRFTMPHMEETKVGAAVRRLREARGLTLRAVAEQAGFSASFLSQVENEQASPSISSMERIAAALGVTLGEFFQTAEYSPAKVIRADSRQTLYSHWSNAKIESLANAELGRSLQAILVTLKAGGSSAKIPHPAPSEEFALVLSGSVVLSFQGQEHELGGGDAITIPPGALRSWHNAARKPTQVVIVSSH